LWHSASQYAQTPSQFISLFIATGIFHFHIWKSLIWDPIISDDAKKQSNSNILHLHWILPFPYAKFPGWHKTMYWSGCVFSYFRSLTLTKGMDIPRNVCITIWLCLSSQFFSYSFSLVAMLKEYNLIKSLKPDPVSDLLQSVLASKHSLGINNSTCLISETSPFFRSMMYL